MIYYQYIVIDSLSIKAAVIFHIYQIAMHKFSYAFSKLVFQFKPMILIILVRLTINTCFIVNNSLLHICQVAVCSMFSHTFSKLAFQLRNIYEFNHSYFITYKYINLFYIFFVIYTLLTFYNYTM